LTEKKREEVRKDAEQQAEERVLDALVGERASSATRESFRSRLYSGDLNDAPVDIEIEDHSNTMIEMSGQGGAQIGMVNLSDMLKGAFGGRTRTKRMTVEEAYDVLVEQEADKLIDQDALEREALDLAENDGIVFLDEVDKIVHRSSERSGGDVSREGVQRDLLPLIEGTVVSTKRGSVKTDFILFIASGAFHVASPSDLLPELQGRLPIRVELKALGRDDFVRILREPEASLTKQYAALLETEGVHLTFTDDGIDAMAGAAAEANAQIENIGARRLMTVIERVLDEASYSAGTDLTGDLTVDRTYVDTRLGDLLRDKDLSKYVL
jgi:ATP-dependent HslUV protease ATP-binding subunit HslU